MAIERSPAGLNIVPLDEPEGWADFLNANWDRLSSFNPIGGFAIIARDVDVAMAPTSRNFSIGAGSLIFGGSIGFLPAVDSMAAPASQTTCVWMDQNGNILTGLAFPSATPFAPLATVTCDATKITSIVDTRNPIFILNHPITIRLTVAPADASLGAGEATLWVDGTPGAARVVFKAKDSAGTVVTGAVPLA